MLSTVTRLRPRTADYDVAVKAYLNGDFAFAIESTMHVASPLVLALRARALFRVGRYEQALAATHMIDVADLGHAYAGELLVLRALALHALEDASWEGVLTEARARAFSSGCVPVECEVEWVTAILSWTQEHIGNAEQAIGRILELTGSAPPYIGEVRTDYLFSTPYWRARAHDVRALIEASREDYLAQAEATKRFFDEFDRAGVPDTYVEVRNLENLAVLVRDLDEPVLADFVEKRAERFSFNEFHAAWEYQIYHAIASNRVRRGDHLGAFRYLRRSAACAPSVAQQIMVIVDRSQLARELGETFTALDDLEHAVRLAKQVDWRSAPSDHRFALAQLGMLMARVNADTARTMWNRYASLKGMPDKYSVAARSDRRVRAVEATAHAHVLIAEGHTSRAVQLLSESLEIWGDVGYKWRAAQVALELAQLTGEPYYLMVAQREAEKYPNSLLAKRAAALTLTPATIPAG